MMTFEGAMPFDFNPESNRDSLGMCWCNLAL